MSSSDALATVTETLRHLLSTVKDGVTVTTKPPSTARGSGNSEQINIFLYSTYYNPAFRNEPMPGSPSGSDFPPMPLILKYLITAYGANDDDISGQVLMGRAMRLLHDHPLLGRADIEGINPDSGLQQQAERIRITPDTLTLDDMSKLWTTFQSAEYRLSVGYEVSVILIESSRTGTAALPVLRRGEEDRGAHVLPVPAARLFGLRFPFQKPAAELENTITLLGEHLSRENTIVQFRHPLLKDSIDLLPQAVREQNEMLVQLPQLEDDPEAGSRWPAGFYTLSLLIQKSGLPEYASNQLSMPLAPTIRSVTPVTASPDVDFTLTVACIPQIRAEQEVLLLFGDHIIAPDAVDTPSDATAPSRVRFTVNAAAKAEPYVVRLRVDGVDSIPVDFSENTAKFADNQKVTVV